MSNIKSGIRHIEIKGKEYGLLFSLNALDEIQTKYGAIDKLDEVFSTSNKDWIKDTKYLLALLINEAAALEEYMEVENPVNHITEQQLGLIVGINELKGLQDEMYKAFAAGSTDDSESIEHTEDENDDEGNATSGQRK